MRLMMYAVIAVMGFSQSVFAASFDCTKARLSAEKTICANRSLNDQDVKLATTFNLLTHVMSMGSRDAMRDDQADWLKQRNACNAKVACLRTAYNTRQQQLDTIVQDRIYAHGPF